MGEVDAIKGKNACPLIYKDIEFVEESGSSDVSLDAGGTTDVTVTHSSMMIGGAPAVSIDNSNITLEVKNITNSGFIVTCTNTDGSNAQSGTLTWSRKGINYS